MKSFTRREFVRQTALAAAAAHLASRLQAGEDRSPAPARPLPEGKVELGWLEGAAPNALAGATWGVAWPRGKQPKSSTFALRTSGGESVPLQSWPLAYWPDGSLKWTGHALPASAPMAASYELAPGIAAVPAQPLSVHESGDSITIDTGVIQAHLPKQGREIVSTISTGGHDILRHGRLVLLSQDAPDTGAAEAFEGEIGRITVEQDGPVRAVVKIEGRHAGANRSWLPFVVRLTFFAGSAAVRVLHTIIFDGDEKKDFIRGLGLRFDVAMSDPVYDRHIRFTGEGDGLFAEAVQGITGLRRDPGAAVREAQIAGRACPPQSEWSKSVVSHLQYVPIWSDYTLRQLSADGFEISKRTKPGYTWIRAGAGKRAGGLGYVGGPSGGVAFGLRNFWQSYPTQFDIHGAAGTEAQVTLWAWSPESAPMDLRGYHDGMGEDDYTKQSDALDITYEDYEPGFDRPEGVARTSEMSLWVLPSTPARQRLVEIGRAVQTPAQIVARPEYLHACAVFASLWSPVDRSTPAKAKIEDELDFFFDYYLKQRDEHSWYGFWNYGDVRHTYDTDRHTWRYDVGGFAWDNSELSTDIWLWLYFLRTGRADVFRFAEAMTRHTGEVDVHHLGRFAPLGSRHNVLHWGCSAKQLRISTAANRRYYYYLTADERVGDLMREQVEAVRALVKIQPGRKLKSARNPGDHDRPSAPDDRHAGVGFGTDWGAVSAAWLTEWERTGDAKVRERLVNSMKTIAAQPHGFFTGASVMELDSGKFQISTNERVGVSHLSAVFGLVEICAELIQLLDVPEFRRAWLDYCELYNATPEEQTKRLGHPLTGLNLEQGHSRLTAFAAREENNPALAQRAWKEFLDGKSGYRKRVKYESTRITGPEVLNPVDEAAFVSTNATAQWGLAAIQCLAMAGPPPV
ncbi:MAG TPA: Tat pathway signal sequence domain protein [Candidatus Didemnitutus sp.]|nr:Tat pathway signal sequence domain protein [Candidatus Didemnitutus sp.]